MATDEGLRNRIIELVGPEVGEAVGKAVSEVLLSVEKELTALVSNSLERAQTDMEKALVCIESTEVREEVTGRMGMKFSQKLQCRLIGEAADLAVLSEERLSNFVAHTIEHYETSEQEHDRRRMVGSLQELLRPIAEERLHRAAAANGSG